MRTNQPLDLVTTTRSGPSLGNHTVPKSMRCVVTFSISNVNYCSQFLHHHSLVDCISFPLVWLFFWMFIMRLLFSLFERIHAWNYSHIHIDLTHAFAHTNCNRAVRITIMTTVIMMAAASSAVSNLPWRLAKQRQGSQHSTTLLVGSHDHTLHLLLGRGLRGGRNSS